MNKSTWLLFLIGIGVAVVLWLVWPTPWRYTSDHKLRFHRLTGRAQVYDANKGSWQDTELIWMVYH